MRWKRHAVECSVVLLIMFSASYSSAASSVRAQTSLQAPVAVASSTGGFMVAAQAAGSSWPLYVTGSGLVGWLPSLAGQYIQVVQDSAVIAAGKVDVDGNVNLNTSSVPSGVLTIEWSQAQPSPPDLVAWAKVPSGPVLIEHDKPWVLPYGFFDGIWYEYLAVGDQAPGYKAPAGATVSVTSNPVWNTVTTKVFLVKSTVPLISIGYNGQDQSVSFFKGAVVWEGIWDNTGNIAGAIPAGEAIGMTLGVTEDFGSSNWQSTIGGHVTNYITNVAAHLVIQPVTSPTTASARWVSGSWGMLFAYYGYGMTGP